MSPIAPTTIPQNHNRTHWLPIAIGAAFGLVAVFGIVTFVNTLKIRQGEHRIAHAYAIRESAHRLLSAMKDTETGQRGFVLTGENEHLAIHDQGITTAESLFEELQTLALHNPEVEDSLVKLRAAFVKQQSHFAQVIALRRRQSDLRVSDEVLDLIRLGGGKAIMDSARNAADEMIGKQGEKLDQIEANTRYLDSLTQSTITVGHLIALVSIVCIGLAAYADRRKREHAESALHKEQNELAAVLEQISEAVVITDLEGVIQSVNSGAERLLNSPGSELEGKTLRDLLQVDEPQWTRELQELDDTGLSISERMWNMPQGVVLVLEQRRSFIRDRAGKRTGKLVLLINITDRKLQEAKERRSQRLESIGTLAGGVAHDLNNVLTPILMSVKLIKRGNKNTPRLLDTIIISAERGSKMLKKLLAFAGGDSPSLRAVDIREIVLEAEEILSLTLPKTIDLQINVAADLPLLLADTTELSQVVLNLAINARDAMPQGGILRIEIKRFHINAVRAERSDRLQPGLHILLSVADTGDGIANEHIDRIFDPFFTTKPQGQGTGLGLASTLGIVRSYGGDINVYSEVGVGTTFSVYFPIPGAQEPAALVAHDAVAHDAVAHEALAHAATRSLTGRGETVLIVDDESAILETARETLECNGYRVLTAASGDEALVVFQQRPDQVDLIMLDMMMPGMDGYQTKAALRAIAPECRILATSGLQRPGSERDQLADTNGFLAKPYSDEQLLQAIRGALENSL